MKRKKNKFVIIIISVLAFVLLVTGVFYGAYYLSVDKTSSSYEGSIKSYVDKINNINLSTASFINGQTIDPEKIRKELPSKTDELIKIKDKIQGIIPTDKNKKDHENLLNGIDKNILIFKQITLILNNPNGNDIDKAGTDLLKYRDDCISFYALANYRNTKPSINNKTSTLIDYTSNYVNELVSAKRDKEIIENQNMDFINSMEEIITKFMPIKIDFSVQLSKARNQNSNFDDVISTINKNKNSLDSLSQEFSNITVPSPSKAISCYQAFNKSIDDYNNYMESLIYSINNEKLSGINLSTGKIDELYASPTSKFNDVIKDYSDFLKSYTDFKDSNLK